MVVTGLVLGLLTGGSPVAPQEVSTLFLVVAMTLALTEIRVEGLRFRTELRAFSVASFWNYGVLTGLVLVFALLTPDPDLRAGWVVMAAVPSAIAVIPLTSILRGNVRSALVSTALLNKEMGPMKAYATGKLKIKASLEDVLRLRKLF